MEDVWLYPRPPALQPVKAALRITFAGQVVAETTQGWRVLETSHPPTYYLPMTCFAEGVLEPAPGRSICEWKGAARYWSIVAGGRRAERCAWSYPAPLAPFEPIRDHLAVYAGPMDSCTVGGEVVVPQPGGFYGGWITRDLKGPFKGAPGSAGW